MTQDRQRKRKGLLLTVVDAVGGLWFGSATMLALLIYCWLGSAGTQPLLNWLPRMALEKTEMEWFAWWPFLVILALFSLSVTIATLRKIPFSLPKLGVYMVHAGILILVFASVVYYSLKQEGDMVVYRRAAVIRVGNGEPVRMVVRPGERVVARGDGRAFQVSVGTLNPEYELLSAGDAGKTSYAIQLLFEPLENDGRSHRFIRQLLVGYPEYTEDVLPGQGRAVKLTGKPLVDEKVSVSLEYAATQTLYLNDRPALYARLSGSQKWTELPIRGLPRYHEFAMRPGDVFLDGEDLDLRIGALNLKLEPDGDTELLPKDLALRVTGFLPFATQRQHWAPGGSEFNPWLSFSVRMGTAELSDALLANDPEKNRLELGGALGVSFKWVESAAGLAALQSEGRPRLVVTIPSRDIVEEIPLTRAAGHEIPIKGTSYSLELKEVYPHWTLAKTGQRAQMAVVRVVSAGKSFHRAVVAPQVELSQDMRDDGQMAGRLVDDGIRIELKGVRETGLVLVSGPAGTHALLVGEDGSVESHPAEPGTSVAFFDGQMQVTVHEVSETAQLIRTPTVIARRERDLQAGSAYSMIQVDAHSGGQAESTWLEYSHYPHSSRAGFFPGRLRLADGRQLELLYSREAVVLPTRVALDSFQLETYPGGTRERDYISMIRFEEDGHWGEAQELRSNQPSERDGWWYFQSTWDPPSPQRGYAGLNYTGLGVGNRHGVGIMLLGSILVILGSIWAFYVKPRLLRRKGRKSGTAAGGAA